MGGQSVIMHNSGLFWVAATLFGAIESVIAAPIAGQSVKEPCKGTATDRPLGAYTGLPQELAVLLKNKGQTIPVSDASVDRMGLRQAAYIAQAARCPSVARKMWQCGDACTSFPDFKLTWTYGDNEEIPYIIIGTTAAMHAVVVAHADSNFKHLDSWLTDLNFD